MVLSIPCMILRGGTSKGIYLKDSDLPEGLLAKKKIILSIFGSPDRRQIDGLGGADPLTSKVCIIGTQPFKNSHTAGADLIYSFGQVGINDAFVDFRALCGNLTSGVGVFAIWKKLIKGVEPITVVKIYNTNLNRMLTAEIPVKNGMPMEIGNYSIPGVPGKGAKINVDFSDTAGASTGKLLPTGNPIDTLEIPGIGALDCSMLDIGNAHVFVRATDLGLKGNENAKQIDSNPDLLDRLELIRGQAALAMGIICNTERSRTESPATPLIAIVAPPQDYYNEMTGKPISSDQCDFLSRLMFMQQAHKTYAGTSTVCTGVASRISGTIVHEVCRHNTRRNLKVLFGHPSGIIETESKIECNGSRYNVLRATLGRTARRIMEGEVFLHHNFSKIKLR